MAEWWVEPQTEYLVERSPDRGDGSRTWTRLTSTCDSPSGLTSFTRLHDDGNSYPALLLKDVYGGVQLGATYAYRVTAIRPDGTSGSAEASYTTSGGLFLTSPVAALRQVPNGWVVTVAAGVSYCAGTTPLLRCDPWKMEVTVTSSSTGFRYSRLWDWVNNHDPRYPPTEPGGVDGTFAAAFPAPSGTHTFSLTAVYEPDFRVDAGSVTVVVP